MGGSWRARDFDPRAWRPPVPRVEARAAAAPAGILGEIAVVIAYIASVFVAMAVMLTLLQQGW